MRRFAPQRIQTLHHFGIAIPFLLLGIVGERARIGALILGITIVMRHAAFIYTVNWSARILRNDRTVMSPTPVLTAPVAVAS